MTDDERNDEIGYSKAVVRMVEDVSALLDRWTSEDARVGETLDALLLAARDD